MAAVGAKSSGFLSSRSAWGSAVYNNCCIYNLVWVNAFMKLYVLPCKLKVFPVYIWIFIVVQIEWAGMWWLGFSSRRRVSTTCASYYQPAIWMSRDRFRPRFAVWIKLKSSHSGTVIRQGRWYDCSCENSTLETNATVVITIEDQRKKNLTMQSHNRKWGGISDDERNQHAGLMRWDERRYGKWLMVVDSV